jgi:hypothetical protein
MSCSRSNVCTCDCGRCYIGETGRPLQVHIKEHKDSLTQDLFQKSKLAQHAYEEGHDLCWKEAKTFHIGTNDIYRKNKVVANISLAAHSVIHPSLHLSPSGLPPVKKLENCNFVQFSSGSIGRVSVG